MLMVGERCLLPTCKFDLDGAAGTWRDCFVVCPDALAAGTASSSVLADWWFRPHFVVCAWFNLGASSAEVQFAVAVSPLSPLAE